jgi:hypothetical protein
LYFFERFHTWIGIGKYGEQPMSRQLATDVEITELINNRFKEGKELDGDCRGLRVSGVTRYDEPDESGCNWTVWTYNGGLGCMGVFKSVVGEIQAKYNLQDD